MKSFREQDAAVKENWKKHEDSLRDEDDAKILWWAWMVNRHMGNLCLQIFGVTTVLVYDRSP